MIQASLSGKVSRTLEDADTTSSDFSDVDEERPLDDAIKEFQQSLQDKQAEIGALETHVSKFVAWWQGIKLSLDALKQRMMPDIFRESHVLVAQVAAGRWLALRDKYKHYQDS